jgi:hypothetical protein
MVSIRVGVRVKGLELLLLLVRARVMASIRVGVRAKGLELLLLLVRARVIRASIRAIGLGLKG